MTLDQWLKNSRLTEAEFAKRIGVTQAAVNRYRQGLRVPKPRTIEKIERTTGGEVMLRDLLRAAQGAAA